MKISPRTARFIAIPLLIAALGFGVYQGFIRFFPLQASRWSSLMDLRSGDVEAIDIEGLRFYRRDTCPKNVPSRFGLCACVALVHGLGDEALTWKRILLTPKNDWTHGVRLYAVDLPGMGASPAPTFERDYQVRKMAAKVASALDTVQGCSSWMLVGNSMGGWVASWMALDWTKKVNRLVLVNSAGLKASAAAREGAAGLLTEPTVDSLKEFQRRAYHSPRPIPEHVWKLIAERAKEGNSQKVVQAQVPEDYLDTYLPSIKVPTFVFWGTSDRVIPRELGREMASKIRGGQLHEAPDCGHMPQKECPVALLKTLNAVMRFGTM